MKQGEQTITFKNGVYINEATTIAGPMESEGPLGKYFDKTFSDVYCEEKNYELAERKLLKESIIKVLSKTNLTKFDIDLFVSGDLLNQNVSSNYVAREFGFPFLGVYAACANIAESLIIGGILVNSKNANNVICSTVSHNSTAERQYRYPNEYGGQKPQTATFTATGAASVLLSKKKAKIKLESVTIGKVIDMGMNNPFDLGGAMAPAAADTINQHLIDTNRTPDYYDLIVTGDLSDIGSKVLVDYLKKEYKLDISKNYNDCGLMLYDLKNQEVFSGGSGSACVALVTFGFLKNRLETGKLKRILLVATGALFSPTMIQQKETIPCIAHAVSLEAI